MTSISKLKFAAIGGFVGGAVLSTVGLLSAPKGTPASVNTQALENASLNAT
jgi:gas vesicle protein